MPGKKRNRNGEEATSADGAPLSTEFYFPLAQAQQAKEHLRHMESLWYKVHCQLKKHVLPCMQFRTGLQSGLAREDVLTAMA